MTTLPVRLLQMGCRIVALGLLGALLVPLPSQAQKDTDPGLALPSAGAARSASVATPAPLAAQPPVAAFAPQPAAAPQPAGERDAEARQLAQRLPLNPATRDLRDRLPADVPAVERQLGLRVPNGPRVDLRGRTPTPREITNALH